MPIAIVAIDLAKHIFERHGLDAWAREQGQSTDEAVIDNGTQAFATRLTGQYLAAQAFVKGERVWRRGQGVERACCFFFRAKARSILRG
jgi:hypothetical protein